MYYKLCDKYSLRGFSAGRECFLLNNNNGVHHFLPKHIFDVLLMCNGKVDFSLPGFSSDIHKILGFLEKRRIIMPCSQGELLSPYQEYKETDIRHISEATWSVTGRCNLKCKHCFQGAPNKSIHDLSTDEALKVIDILGENFITRVNLTGGEPLVRPDIEELFAAFNRNHIKVCMISSNGVLLNERIITLFKKYDMQPSFQISFDGVGCHDWLRGVPGTEEKVIRAIKLCAENDIKVVMATCLHKDNLYSLDDTVKLAESLGCVAIKINPVTAFNNYSNENGVRLLSQDEVYNAYLSYLPRFVESNLDIHLEFGDFISVHGKNPGKYVIPLMQHNCMNLDTNKVCQIVMDNIYISDTGRVMPCIRLSESSAEDKFEKITETGVDSFYSEAFTEFMSISARDVVNNNDECKDCQYLPHCGCGCRGVAASDGSLYGKDEERCAFFKGEWAKKIDKVMEPYK